MAGLNVWAARLSPAAKRSPVQTRITTLYEWGGPPGLPYLKFYILGPRLRIDVHLVSSYQARACTIPSPVRALNMATFRPPDPEEKDLIPITAEWRGNSDFTLVPAG